MAQFVRDSQASKRRNIDHMNSTDFNLTTLEVWKVESEIGKYLNQLF